MRLLITAALISLAACVPPRAHVDPSRWTPVQCIDCAGSNVRVESRRSIAVDGKAGTYVLARVSNDNTHPIALTVDLATLRFPSGDPDLPGKQLRMTLDSRASTVVVVDFNDIVAARISGVERF
jgi:hypothetical protein